MKKTFTSLSIIAFFFFQLSDLKAQANINSVNYNGDGSVSLITFKEGTSKKSMTINQESSNHRLNEILQLPNEIELRLKKVESSLITLVLSFTKPILMVILFLEENIV